MKMNLYQSFAAIILLGAIATACNSGTKNLSENDLQFKTTQVEKVYNLLNNPENPGCNLQIKFTYPSKYANAEILKKIQAQFISSYYGEQYEELSPEEATNQYVDEYIKNYQTLEDDFREEVRKSDNSPLDAWFSYYEMSSNEIVYNKADLLSYTINYESFTGGAHGAHSTINHVLNLVNGEQLTEEDIFVDNFQDTLAEILVDQIAKQNNVEDAKELENIGFFSIDEIYPNGNFLVDDSGITYDFNEYEIAAYVVGVTNVHLPYSAIRHLLRPNSPISPLVNSN